MRFGIIILVMIVILGGIALANTYTQDYLNYLTRTVADGIYCRLYHNCNLLNVTINNTIHDANSNSRMYYENGVLVVEG